MTAEISPPIIFRQLRVESLGEGKVVITADGKKFGEARVPPDSVPGVSFLPLVDPADYLPGRPRAVSLVNPLLGSVEEVEIVLVSSAPLAWRGKNVPARRFAGSVEGRPIIEWWTDPRGRLLKVEALSLGITLEEEGP